MALSFQCSKLPINHVTVFNDRAEVCRVIKCQVNQGINNIIVEKLSDSIDSNSIRVEGYGHKSSIVEVKFEEKPSTIDEKVKNREIETLHDKSKELTGQKKAVELSIERIKCQKQILTDLNLQFGYKENVPPEHKISTSVAILTDKESMDNLSRYLDFYSDKVGEIDTSLCAMEKNLEKITDELNLVQIQIKNVGGYGSQRIKQVAISVQAEEATEIVLNLFYLVSNASWAPSYDVRVQNEPAVAKIIYYGIIKQQTGEDWQDAKLTLSTASPILSGQVPELKRTFVLFKSTPVPCEFSDFPAGIYGGVSSKTRKRTSPPPMPPITTTVTENVTSTKFNIAVPGTIPSDNATHKVTIAIVDLAPEFGYESVPSKSAYAYLIAKVTNSSDYPFLAGPTSIFFRDSFVAHGQMKSANVRESFEVSLGVDPALKVEYKSVEKFHSETGLVILRNKRHVMTYEQQISLSNTKTEVVTVKIIEPLPMSTDSKLKVDLIEPVLSGSGKSDKKLVKLNKSNNVEWIVKLKPGEKRDLVFKYQIEYPKSETLKIEEEDLL